jgi:uncharacterized protein YndB with AHSA1/START domain
MTQQAESAVTAPSQAPLTGSFTVERDLAASPDRVFAAYSEPGLRRRWFRIPGNPPDADYELDFRPAGHEVSRGRFAPSGVAGTEELIEYRSVFWDIVPGKRLVFGYELVLDGIRRWVSLVTVELSALPYETLPDETLPHGAGTRLRHTEQYVLLAYAGDGTQDAKHLKGSTPLQLNALALALSMPS